MNAPHTPGTALAEAGQRALAPVRAALLARADEQAERLRAEATEQADAVRRAAATEAEAVRAAARTEGEAAARDAAAATLHRRRRQARALVLAAEQAAYAGLLEAVTDAVRARTAEPGWPARAERLAALAGERLGPDATVQPDPDGGLVARAGSRSLDLSVPALARHAVGELGDRVVRLWS